jgi:hypothetical protein
MIKAKWIIPFLFLLLICGSLGIGLFFFFSETKKQDITMKTENNPVEEIISKKNFMSHKLNLVNVFDISRWDFKDVFDVKWWINNNQLIIRDDINYIIQETFYNNIEKLDLYKINNFKKPQSTVRIISKNNKVLVFYFLFSFDNYNYYYDKITIDFNNSFSL